MVILHKLDAMLVAHFKSIFTSAHLCPIDLVMYEGGYKNFRNCYKNLFKIFLQDWNFSPLQSTAPVTGCSDPCNAPTAGNIV